MPVNFPGRRGGRGVDAVALGSSYLLGEPLGRGGMGRVFKGATRIGGQQVAVKVLNPELAADPEVVSRFLQERGILVGLHHPHLVGVRDLVAEGETLAIVMDLVDGDLRRYLAERGPLTAAFSAGLMAQVLTGLAAVHAAGIVHRDLKPENILLDRSQGDPPRARLSDFGIARLTTGPALTRTTGLIGTPDYMAPEMADQHDVGPPSDVYAAGIVLYELLTGRTPFGGGAAVAVLRRHLDEAPTRPDGVSDALWQLLSEMLAKQPELRPTAAQAAERLVAVVPSLLAASEASEGSATTEGDPFATRLPGYQPARPSSEAVRTGRMAVPLPLEGAARPGSPAAPDLQPTVLPGRVRAPEPPRPAAPAAAGVPRRTVLIVGAVVVALLATILGVGLLGHGGGSAPGTGAVSYSFPRQTQPDGLAVDRAWSFADAKGGHLHEELRLTNTTSKPLDSTYDELVPKEIASSASVLSFSPPPDRVVAADPVVRYAVHALAPKQVATFAYDATVPASGASEQRLKSWAASQAQEADAYQRQVKASTLTRLVVEPHAMQLVVGQVVPLSVSGVDADGSPATAAQLAQEVQFTSNPPGFVQVDPQGDVTAVKPGTTQVVAQSGSASDTSRVTVTAPPAAAAPAPAQAAPAPAGPPAPAPPPANLGPGGTPLDGGKWNTGFEQSTTGCWSVPAATGGVTLSLGHNHPYRGGSYLEGVGSSQFSTISCAITTPVVANRTYVLSLFVRSPKPYTGDIEIAGRDTADNLVSQQRSRFTAGAQWRMIMVSSTLAFPGRGLYGYVYLKTPGVPLDIDEVAWTVSS
jgi:Protein kinase domain